MMKLIVIIVMFASLMATGCSRPPTWATSKNGAVRIQLPAHWKVEEEPASTLFARAYDGEQRIPGLYVLVGHDLPQSGAAGAADLGSYIEFKDMQAEGPAIENRVTETLPLTLDGAPAQLRVRRLVTRLDSRMSVVALTVRQSGGWIVVGSAPVETFPKWRAELEQIVRSVDWRDP